jgi:glycosyltransferase involved in cell wall biosynthesis
VSFIPIKPSFTTKYWDFSLKGIIGFYRDYRKWHEDVFLTVSDMIKKDHYDLIHFLGPIGYHEPGKLYQLPIPYIWGPVGGMGKAPARMLVESDLRYGTRTGIKMLIKSYMSRIRLRINKRVKDAFRKSDVVVGATTEYVSIIRRILSKTSHSIIQYLPENCINELNNLDYSKFNTPIINLVFIGRLDTGKAPMIVLESLARIKKAATNIHVDFIGAGPLTSICQEFIMNKSLQDVVTIHGQLERSAVFTLLSRAHLMLLPSLYDANTTVVWEAMAYAVPTLCLDHCGMHDTIKEKSGIKIPVSSFNRVISNVSLQLKRISEHPEILQEMAESLIEDRAEYSWESRMAKFEKLYDLAIEQYYKR